MRHRNWKEQLLWAGVMLAGAAGIGFGMAYGYAQLAMQCATGG